jgi:hypothetical protein
MFDSEDFLTLYQPGSCDVSKLESLLTKYGFKAQVHDGIRVWSGRDDNRNNVTLVLSKKCIYVTNSLKIENGSVYIGEYVKRPVKGRFEGDKLVLDKTFASQPRVREFRTLIRPNTFLFNIETPSLSDSVFGETHQTFGMALAGNTLHVHNSCFYESRDAANQAYRFHTERRGQNPAVPDDQIGRYVGVSEKMTLKDKGIVWESTYKRE